MIGEPNTTIHLTSEEAELFKLFRQYHEPFKAMVESSLFDTKSGTANLSFKDGILMNIEIQYQVYKRHHQQQ